MTLREVFLVIVYCVPEQFSQIPTISFTTVMLCEKTPSSDRQDALTERIRVSSLMAQKTIAHPLGVGRLPLLSLSSK